MKKHNKRNSLVVILASLFILASAGSSAQYAAGKYPDFNGNEKVGFEDYFMFADEFGKAVTAENRKFDLNSDNKIDFDDFFIFSDEFGKVIQSGNTQDTESLENNERIEQGLESGEIEIGGVSGENRGDANLDEKIEKGLDLDKININLGTNIKGIHVMTGEILEIFVEVPDESVSSLINFMTADVKINEGYIETSLALDNSFTKWNGELRVPDIADGTYSIEVTIHINFGDNLEATKGAIKEFVIVAPNPAFCKELIPGHNNPDADRANIVFFGYGYTDTPLAAKEEIVRRLALKSIDIEETEEGLFSVEPFKSNQNKFNFWYVSEIGDLESDCENLAGDSESGGHCNNRILESHCTYNNEYSVNFINTELRANALGSINQPALVSYQECPPLDYCVGTDLNGDECSNDEDFIIYKSLDEDGRRQVNPNIIRCVDYNYGCDKQRVCEPTLGFNFEQRTFVHEFGHLFGQLRDEYSECSLEGDCSYQGVTDPSAINCYAGDQNTIQQCIENSPWKNLIGQGCGDESIVDCQEQFEAIEGSFPEGQAMLEIGCFEGCLKSGSGIFRNAFNTIMRNQGIDPYSFGEWNKRHIQSLLNQFGGE